MAYSVSNIFSSNAAYPHGIRNGQRLSSSVVGKNSAASVTNPNGVGSDIKAYYAEVFDRYANVQEHLLEQLNAIFGKHISMDGNRHVNFTDFIKDVCTDADKANEAYKFYGRQIIEQINRLGDYILKARVLLQQADGNAQKYAIDQLEILRIFSREIEEAFGFHYVYDFNEDTWKFLEDDYAGGTHSQVRDGRRNTYEELRKTEVDAYEKEGVFTKKIIEVFNELNLLDRLKYIKLYYDIDGGKSDAVFPNDKVSGTPVVKEASDTEIRAAIEQFFMGYLIDRDGPVNAVASYLEVKSAALIEKINLETKKIKSLNAYLKFLNRALDVLNGSQSGAKDNEKDGKGKITAHNQHRIPDGAMLGLLYLCGGNMYNLFEKDGQSYLVFDSRVSVSSGQWCFLVRADESGMRFLIGDNGAAEGCRGNSCCGASLFGGIWDASLDGGTLPGRYSRRSSKQSCFYYDASLGTWVRNVVTGFKFPNQLECEKIAPESVRRYSQFKNADEVTTDTVSSWQQAFQNKISFIDSTIETVSTDIKLLRNKIDTLSGMGTTFRSRTHNAYARVASNIRK